MDHATEELYKERQQANMEILSALFKLAQDFPGLRFGQLLASLDILQYGEVEDGIVVKDPFNEESKVILARVQATLKREGR